MTAVESEDHEQILQFVIPIGLEGLRWGDGSVSSYRLNSIQWLEFSSSLQVNFARPHEND